MLNSLQRALCYLLRLFDTHKRLVPCKLLQVHLIIIILGTLQSIFCSVMFYFCSKHVETSCTEFPASSRFIICIFLSVQWLFLCITKLRKKKQFWYAEEDSYHPEHMFIMYETSIFWKKMPSLLHVCVS